MEIAMASDEKNKTKKLPKYLYRYIPFERLAEVIMTRSLPIPFPKNWNDQHDLDNVLNKIPSGKVIGVACLTETWETSFHWDLFAKYGVRLKFNSEKLKKRVSKMKAKLKDVEYASYDTYIKKMTGRKPPLFVKRKQYESEQEWRIVCQVPIGLMATKNVVMYIPFEWDDLVKITFSPHYGLHDYYFYKAMILKMLEAVGAKNIEIKHSSLFESKKIKDADHDYKEG